MKTYQLRQLIEEAYFEVLSEQPVLKSSSQEILGKFPTVKKTLVDLLTPEFNEFVKDVKWVAPKPSTFEVVLQNGERFFLKWLGKSFSVQVAGKSYDLSKVSTYQQALNRINDILKTGPIRTTADAEAEEQEDSGFADDFGGADDFGAADDFAAGDDIGAEELPADDEVEFEEPEEEPDFNL
jgi:hypothetical protein